MGMFANEMVKLANAWLGKSSKNGTHKEIIDIYNNYKPHPRGYAVKYDDAWCATFISALAIKLGYTSIIPPECGCGEMMKLFQAKGNWIEDENRKPNVGDLVFYDWNDSGNGNNLGYPRHVGLVVSVGEKTFTTIEGNVNNNVVKRVLDINAKTLRGFAVPKYDSEPSESRYEQIGRLCEKVLNDVEGLNSYKELMNLLAEQ